MNEEIKSCCARFYQNDLIQFLLGESFHPGGVELTRRLGEKIDLKPEDCLLDVASGNGTSAVYLVKEFGCKVVGLDYSHENIQKAKEKAREERLENLEFRVGDAEALPFESKSFDAVISECALCTFSDKETAASEMFRILKKGGRIGITDVTVTDKEALPKDMKDLIYRISCIAGAKTINGYETILENARFRNIAFENHDYALLDLVEKIKKRVFLAEVAIGLGKLDIENINMEKGRRMIQRTREEIEKGILGYVMMTGEK
ncbi:MAG: class I SAM-dependent methyltransferase [Candidatus Hydrothermarchaeales archaeon]